ncbi:MAG: NYN domain-containing protein [Paracoccaceae bacterium]|nr:NYN domain-containing protein [Paracoccaceae bacterium]MDE2917404.1 NYN domain-containing protein [Paracoccaceae bacterium]
MRTQIYVDGFNLYYGALRYTPYKWLDLSALFRNMLKPHHQILAIKYFTARVESRENDPGKPQRQDFYLRALRAHCQEIGIIEGKFKTRKSCLPLVEPPHSKVRVLRTEEKGSDVNLAVHLLNDAWQDEYDCAVVVSNDSDLAEAMRLVREQREKFLGLMTPGNRHPSQDLTEYANFHRNIRRNLLERSQLPDLIPGTNISKPEEW